ncbi:5'-nucleotidase, cytosolic III [Phlyctochytrium planicorne]|nr:5'-nucleotidase, cytosolic III [Phlyctochytrium planicorne]
MSPSFFSDIVVTKDGAEVTKKLEQIIAGGAKKLHIISDFDMTMTKYWVNGKRSPSSHAILTRSPSITQEFKDRSDDLYKKYYPIEISSTVSTEVKFKAMEEWWIEAHKLIVELNLGKSDLTRMIHETQVTFRQGLDEVIKLSASMNVPFLVFSAGLYDVIREILDEAGLKPPSLHVVSNRMKFNENDICVGFHDPLIHVMNKNEANVKNSPYAGTLEGRENVINLLIKMQILMGDSLGDLQMAEGLKNKTLLTIGFLNYDKDRLLESYLNAFDIVILDDSSFDPILNLLHQLIKIK